MIPRLSPTWRTARSTFGSSRATTGNTTSSSRLRLSLAKPTTDVSGVRSSCETLARNRLFASFAVSAAARGLLGLRHRLEQVAGPLGDAAPRARGSAASSSARSRAASSAAGQQRAHRVEQRAVLGARAAARRRSCGTSEHADDPALGHQRRADEPGRAEDRRERGGWRRRRRPPRRGTAAARRRGRPARAGAVGSSSGTRSPSRSTARPGGPPATCQLAIRVARRVHEPRDAAPEAEPADDLGQPPLRDRVRFLGRPR